MHIDPKQRIKESELNMTPMIDVVFLLITFFMVVSEITRQDDIEDIKLPLVMAAIPDDNPDPDRLVINVLKDGAATRSSAAGASTTRSSSATSWPKHAARGTAAA